MKKKLTMLFGLVLISGLPAKEIEVGEIKCYYYNEFLEGQTDTKVILHYYYDEKDPSDNPVSDNLFLIFPFDDVYIPLDSTERNELVAFIDKYKEWNKKASRKKIKLNKELGKLELRHILFDFGETMHPSINTTITLHFLSQTPTKHQFCIIFPELISSKNEYITKKPETLYFWWKEINQLRAALTDSAMNTYRAKEKKAREIDEEFK